MKISDVLIPELAMCDLDGCSKKKVLENISQFIAQKLGSDQEQAFTLFRSMLARERLGSTGIGKGVAIPHCQVCLLYTSPSPRDLSTSRMPSSA